MLPCVYLVFRAFDHNGDGSISRDELLDAMQRFGHSFSEAECDEMFTQVSVIQKLHNWLKTTTSLKQNMIVCFECNYLAVRGRWLPYSNLDSQIN